MREGPGPSGVGGKFTGQQNRKLWQLATRCAPVRIASGVAAGTGAPDDTARTGTARAVVAGSVYRWAAPWHLHSADANEDGRLAGL